MRHDETRRTLPVVIRVLAALALFTSSATFAVQTCTRPQAPDVPSGANADLETMITVRTDVDGYLDRMQIYVDCLASESEDANAEADRVVEQWNTALQNFERKP